MKPLIGITTTPKMDDNLLLDRVPHEYATSIQRAGGLPLLIPTLADAACIGRLDGILFSGGDADVDPARFGEDPVRQLRLITPERDEMDLSISFYILRGGLRGKLAAPTGLSLRPRDRTDIPLTECS